MSATRYPNRAMLIPRFALDVVFPTPPFPLVMTITCASPSPVGVPSASAARVLVDPRVNFLTDDALARGRVARASLARIITRVIIAISNASGRHTGESVREIYPELEI